MQQIREIEHIVNDFLSDENAEEESLDFAFAKFMKDKIEEFDLCFFGHKMQQGQEWIWLRWEFKDLITNLKKCNKYERSISKSKKRSK